MRRFKVICYPNVESYETEVEADNIEEAIEIAEDEAQRNTCFFATEKDVEETIVEEKEGRDERDKSIYQ